MFSEIVGCVVLLDPFMRFLTRQIKNATALVLAIAEFIAACEVLLKAVKRLR